MKLGPVLFVVLLLCASALHGQGIFGDRPPQVDGTTAHTVKVGNLIRTYHLHVPAKLPKDKAVPLVLMFHGGGGTANYAERESRFSPMADRKGFLVAYPAGIGKSWNDGRGDKNITAQRDNIDDVAFIAALLDDVAKEHKLDTKRVYATGISNGAIFCHRLATNLSPRIAAIAPVAGGMPEAWSKTFKPEKPVSVLIVQGTDDPLVHYAGGEITVPFGKDHGKIIPTDNAVRKWVEHDGCNREPVTVELPDKDPTDGCRVKKYTYSKGKDGTEVILLKIEGGGHSWPDGLQYLPKGVIGRVCRDINGTEAIWEFFRTHPKCE